MSISAWYICHIYVSMSTSFFPKLHTRSSHSSFKFHVSDLNFIWPLSSFTISSIPPYQSEWIQYFYFVLRGSWSTQYPGTNPSTNFFSVTEPGTCISFLKIYCCSLETNTRVFGYLALYHIYSSILSIAPQKYSKGYNLYDGASPRRMCRTTFINSLSFHSLHDDNVTFL